MTNDYHMANCRERRKDDLCFISVKIQKRNYFLGLYLLYICMRKTLPTFLLIFACSAGFSQSPDNTAMKFAKIINAEDARKHLSVLASDEYEGRETCKPGQKKAAQYIADDFKIIGLKPTKDNNYFQKFPLTLSAPDDVEMKVGEKKYENFKDLYLTPYGKNLKLTAKD